MRTFKDSENREWTIALNVTAVKRVRDLCEGFNLAQIKPELLNKLADDPVLFCDVLYVLCKPQADEHEITDEQFGSALNGDAIYAATNALMEELVDFTRSPAQRKFWKKALERSQELEAKGMARLETYLETGALDERLDSELKMALETKAPPETTTTEEAPTSVETPPAQPETTPISSD